MRLLTDLRRDIALGVRLLVRDRGFSAVSIATLAVAIGGNTAVFTIGNALLLTPPPGVEPARLTRGDTGQSLTSWPTYEDIRDRSDVFAGVAAYRLASMPLEMGGTTARLRGQITSSNDLTVLGIPAERGRTYLANETTFDRVVLAHHVWRQYFGSDPAMVGRTIVIGGRSFQVAGVMPQGFRDLTPPGVRLDFWLPGNPLSDSAGQRNRLVSQFEIVGRLKPGVERASATAALRPLAQRLRAEHPELPESFLSIEAGSIEGANQFQGMASLLLPVFAFLALLTVVSGFVLVIGCSNIAGLLVGRAAMRQREIAVRLSLGSSQGRLLRQLLTESLVLAVVGGAAGLLVAVGLVDVTRIGVARLPVPLELDFALDHRVLVYVLGLSTATSVFFGLLPARCALRVDLVSSLKTESSGSPERQRLRRLMVTAQVAVCSALVVWSVLVCLPLRQEYSHVATLFARTSDRRATAAVMMSEWQRLLPDADVTVESMADAIAVAVLPARIGATATGVFGAIAVALAACGVYGLVSFSVIQRTREIGIRRAIGATTADIVRLVVRHHAILIGLGLAIGVTTGALGATLLRAFLTGVEPTDPIALFAAVALVAGCALAASIMPALRAAHLDPMTALRDT